MAEKTEALLIIDVQEYWAQLNPKTTERIKDRLDCLRGKLKIIWIYAQDADMLFYAKAPVRVGSRKIGDLVQTFNKSTALQFMPAITPAPEDWVIGKGTTDAYSNPFLKPFLEQQGIMHQYMAGFMEGYCVYDTGVSGQASGIPVSVFGDLVADAEDRNDGEGGNFDKAGIAKIDSAAFLRLRIS